MFCPERRCRYAGKRSDHATRHDVTEKMPISDDKQQGRQTGGYGKQRKRFNALPYESCGET